MSLYRQKPYTLQELNLRPQDTVTPVQEPLSQKMGRGIGEFLLNQGLVSDPRRAYRTGQTLSGMLGMLPVIGDAQAGDEMATAVQEGDSLGMGLGLMSAVPVVGKAAKKATEAMQSAKGYIPQKTVKAYKLFRTKDDGELYPLFVDANTPVKRGEWVDAIAGDKNSKSGKVKSKIGDLAYRAGWHAGDSAGAKHIGGKALKGSNKPEYRPANQVWAEVEMPMDFDWQSEANSRASIVKSGPNKGKLNSKEAHITDAIPFGGSYRYKTNPNMEGNWIISGNMKVNDIISPDEVKAMGADLPMLDEFIVENNVKLSDLRQETIKELKKYYPELYQAMTK